MSVEIERKFLVKGDFRPFVRDSVRISQAYLCSAPERTVRVRLRGDRGYLTIKGPGNEAGTSRYEWEKEISAAEAEALLGLCEPGGIDKTRHLIDVDGSASARMFEVDEFHGENEGLILAEIELSSEDEDFPRPDWLGKEVTGDVRYYNSYLSAHPFKNW